MTWILAVFAPLFNFVVNALARPLEGDLIDSAQLAFALKASGYVPRLGACGVLRKPYIMQFEPRTVIVRALRKRKVRRKHTS